MQFKDFYYFTEGVVSPKKIQKNPGKEKVVVIPGRFSPPTKGHLENVKIAKEKYPKNKIIVYLIKGTKSSEDKDRNPLPEDVQKKLLEKTLSGVADEIRVLPNAFISTIVNDLRPKYEPIALFCGTDRKSNYDSMVKQYGKQMNLDMKVVTTKRQEGKISGSLLRDAIRNDNYNAFIKMTHGLDEKDYKTLRKYIKK